MREQIKEMKEGCDSIDRADVCVCDYFNNFVSTLHREHRRNQYGKQSTSL